MCMTFFLDGSNHSSVSILPVEVVCLLAHGEVLSLNDPTYQRPLRRVVRRLAGFPFCEPVPASRRCNRGGAIKSVPATKQITSGPANDSAACSAQLGIRDDRMIRQATAASPHSCTSPPSASFAALEGMCLFRSSSFPKAFRCLECMRRRLENRRGGKRSESHMPS